MKKAVILLVLAIAAVAGAAQAQHLPRYERNFTLPVEVRWGHTVVAPGNYTLTLDPAGPDGLIALHGEGRATVILPRAIARHAGPRENMLIVRREGEVRTVEALYLADLDLVLYYGRKQHIIEDDAQGIERIPVLWVPQGACPEYCLG